ncbi:hypothetical protein GCM10011376_27340 [Nocardioides flavus (ex Wang et al. 2016)]|uniref:Glutamate mutase n=1 Tax=Nocardioides flavus (ex Wang et al. 2016) TaxID=2058780 RepID=A0ABQ3HPN5_9ACTN|nr:glutamate mutase L [Nocardioides flavus (ex Wang et al. 2016)]GHE18124.1 hypothetical protein GCM10011376_27340 [Nocardioides flavus (ex Wang et al. 2016)]
MSTDCVVCVDFGSTFTKAALVDLGSGALLATASHPTTLPDERGDGDVLDGYDACVAALAEQDPRASDADVLACSSAGGGLRIAVVGNEELVTAEAGRRVALSSGGKVVLVLHGGLDTDKLAALREAAPDVVLLVGGTDGGNAEVLEGDATFLSRVPWTGPVVVAGNVESQPLVADLLTASGTPHVLADNVVPRIGVLAPDCARRAIREIFLSHVIGGKHLSSRADARGRTFTAMVRGATPDVVLTGVELLARGLDDEHPGAGDVVVVDVGGATTDVHSVVELDPETASVDGQGLAREVVATTPVTRTVEGDLGMRWSALSTVEAAGLDDLHDAAVRRRTAPDLLPDACPDPAAEREADLAIAAAACRIALERHAGRSKVVVSPEGRVVERSGKDLREVDLLVGSGGVLRHGGPDAVRRVLAPATGDAFEGGWQLPRDPAVVVDHDYVLAAAGLLTDEHPVAAHRLVRRLVPPGSRGDR